ncbi:MAG TPA: AAA family ATPase [Candidatus Saccharimonadales bacterium]|jgi:dephospho-CoA kinase
MKVFITASSGVGKSSVINELASRGYTAYDADDRDLELTRLEVAESGELAEWPKGYVDWHYYSWNANEERLKELLATNETVFLAGLLGNQEKLYHYFDKLVALTINPSEHERRLRTRQKRDVGDDEKNIQRRLEKYPMHMAKFIASGFITIDNTGPARQTVDQMLLQIAD